MQETVMSKTSRKKQVSALQTPPVASHNSQPTTQGSATRPAEEELIFTDKFFPIDGDGTPFRQYLNSLFFDPRADNQDFPIHGPNVIRLTKALIANRLESEPGLLTGSDKERDRIRNTYLSVPHYAPRYLGD
jgi:hypothetical protein